VRLFSLYNIYVTVYICLIWFHSVLLIAAQEMPAKRERETEMNSTTKEQAQQIMRAKSLIVPTLFTLCETLSISEREFMLAYLKHDAAPVSDTQGVCVLPKAEAARLVAHIVSILQGALCVSNESFLNGLDEMEDDDTSESATSTEVDEEETEGEEEEPSGK